MRDLIEASIDIGSGFIIALLIQFYIFPLFGLYPTISVGIKIIILSGFIIGMYCFYKDHQAKKNKHDNQL